MRTNSFSFLFVPRSEPNSATREHRPLQRPMPRGTKNSLPRGTRSLPNINRVVNRAHRLRIWANSSGKGLSQVQRVTKRRERRRRGTASGTRRNGSRDRETESSFGQSDPAAEFCPAKAFPG